MAAGASVMTNKNSIIANNITTYLGLDCVTVCGMTEIVDRDLITTSDFDTIVELTKIILDKI
jgi:2-keto-3-deoxy-6-phosphogluconate aldolase